MNILNFLKKTHLNEQPLVNPIVDPMCPNKSSLTFDVKCVIFQNVKAELPYMALVCKNWKAIVDDKQLRSMICPTKAFGSHEWKEYMGVNAGEEPLLPRRAYGDMENGDYYLTFIPEKIKTTERNGKLDKVFMNDKLFKEISLNSLEVIGQIVSNSVKGYKLGYTENSLKEPIEEKRTVEKPHWVLMKKERIGLDKTYQEMQLLINEENNKLPGAKISGLIDTTISLFLEYVRYGLGHYRSNLVKIDNKIEILECSIVRVNEQANERQLSLSFNYCGNYSGNYCGNSCGLHVFTGYGDKHPYIGFLPAWKSFENAM